MPLIPAEELALPVAGGLLHRVVRFGRALRHAGLDANPGRINHTWFQVDHTGTYSGQCAELCGVLHAEMFITVNAVTPEEFERWIQQKKKGA